MFHFLGNIDALSALGYASSARGAFVGSAVFRDKLRIFIFAAFGVGKEMGIVVEIEDEGDCHFGWTGQAIPTSGAAGGIPVSYDVTDLWIDAQFLFSKGIYLAV